MVANGSVFAKVRVAVVGCGAWGRNIVRDVAASIEADLIAVVDAAEPARARARALAPGARVVATLEDALALGVEAVIVASPPAAHAAHAITALGAGAHVLVEKPLATEPRDLDAMLDALARAPGRVGVVGHVMRHHPGVERLVELATNGSLGALRYAAARRLSPGGSGDASVVWALAPHDLSIFRAVGASPVVRADVELVGQRSAFVDVRLASGLVAHVELSREHPLRERRLTVLGDRAVAILDDTTAPGKLGLCEKPAASVRDPGEVEGWLADSASEIAWHEVEAAAPLERELAHFFACVRGRALPRADFAEGAEVARALFAGLARFAGASRPTPSNHASTEAKSVPT